MTCQNITFGIGNHIEDAVLTATPAPVTDIDDVKNYHRARQTRWTDLSGDIVIEGVLPEQRFAEYFAIPGSDLGPGATVTLELFETDTSTTDLLDAGPMDVGSLVPLGMWRVGIDPWGVRQRAALLSDVLLRWIKPGILFQKFRLTIQHGIQAPGVIEYEDFVRQGEDGIVCIEAESCTLTPTATDQWQIQSLAGASGGTGIYNISGQVYPIGAVGPTFGFEFRANRSGVHNVWLRIHSTDGDSIYAIFDGQSVIASFIDAQNQGHIWIVVRQVSLVAEQLHNMVFMARDKYLFVDKIVIQPSTTAAPSGGGPPESTNGVVGYSGSSVSLRSLMIGESLTLERNFRYGSPISYVTEPGLVYSSAGFSLPTGAQNRARQFGVVLEQCTDADKMMLAEAEMQLLGKPFIVSAFPDRSDWMRESYTMLARLPNATQYTHVFEDMHEVSLYFVEA